MQEDTTQTSQTNQQPVKRRPIVRRAVLLMALAILLVGGSGAGAYYYRDQQAKDAEVKTSAQITSLQVKISSLEKLVASQTSTTNTDQTNTACSPKQPSASAVENIKASITSGNTAALEGYMATSVTVTYAASDGLGARTAPQAVSDVTSFIGDITQVSWGFNVSASVLSSYGQGSYGKYFPGTALVAKSSTSKVLSFSFDCNGKISTVFFAASESLLQ